MIPFSLFLIDTSCQALFGMLDDKSCNMPKGIFKPILTILIKYTV